MDSLYDLFEQTAAKLNLEIDTFKSNNLEHPIVTMGGAKVRVSTYFKKFKEHVFNSMEMDFKEVVANESAFYKFLVEYCKARNKYTSGTRSKITDVDEAERLKDMVLCRDTSYSDSIRETRYFLLNAEGNISDIPASHYIAVMGIKSPAEESMGVLPIYLPDAPQGTFEQTLDTGEVVVAANSYLPPKYMAVIDKVQPRLPKEVATLFSQVRGEMDTKFFYHFLACCIKSKNTGFLIMQGEGGLGKSTMKAVIKALVGNRNYSEGRRRAVIGDFNTNILNTKCTILDEFKYGMDDLPALKELPNEEMSIEEKFKSAKKTVKMFSSFVIMNNRPKDNWVFFNERKFFPIDLHERRLETILDPDSISAMVEKLNEKSPDYDAEYVASIAKFLLEKGYRPDLFPQGEYRGPRFWKLCHTSMAGWQKAVVTFLSDPIGQCGEQIGRPILDSLEKGELLFSVVQSQITKKLGKSLNKNIQFPGDFSSAYEFLKIFRDLKGNFVYDPKPPHDEILGDFMVAKYKSAEDDL